MVKNLPANAGDTRDAGSIPELGRSPGGELGDPLQYSCLENPMDRGAWRAAARGVTESDRTDGTHTRSLVDCGYDAVYRSLELIPVASSKLYLC